MLKYDADIVKKIHSLGSRKTVGFILGMLHKENEKVVAAYADVGSRFDLIREMGNGGLQVSIAEGSLIGMISGLCHEGFIPYGVAYAPFITMRAADQIRMSVGEMNLGIKIIGGSAGLVSGNLGSASMALDDLALMRGIPNLIIFSPADCLEEAKIIETAAKMDQPVYIRLTGGNVVAPIYTRDFEYYVGKANIVIEMGRDAVIYATGVLTAEAIQAAYLLQEKGIRCTVADMHTIKPLDEQIIEQFSDIPLAVSVEEHNVIGGLGSAIAECLVHKGNKQKFERIGVNDCYPAPNSYDVLLEKCGLTSEKIAERIEELLL